VLPNGQNPPLPTSITPPNPTLQGTMTDLTLLDLELLHHFTTVTYQTLPLGSGHSDLWQVQVVRLGFSHDFLMRIILAVAALHLGVLRPTYRAAYAIKASHHQGIALESVREVLNLGVDGSNCHAIFAFGLFVVMVAFGTPRSEAIDFDSAQKDILEGLQLARGCNSIVQPQWQHLSTGPLAPILREGMHNETIPLHQVPGSDEITGLLRLCSNPSVAEDRDVTNAYYLAIHELLKSYSQLSLLKARGLDMVAATFVWPVAVPQRFLTLLAERKTEAMVILAYYAVLLHGIDDKWFMTGWAKYLVSTIEKSIGDDWTEWLMFPREKVE
jgi:hypothetical protein